MDLSTVNVQAEFRKFLFAYLVVMQHSQTGFRKSKLLYGDLEWTSQQLTSKLNFENSFLDIWKWL